MRAAEYENYRQHLILRDALATAMKTGRPALLGKDLAGFNLYLEPPLIDYPGVSETRRVNQWLTEMVYGDLRDKPGVDKQGRYFRVDCGAGDGNGGGMGGMGVYGFGGVSTRQQGQGWDTPSAEYMRPDGGVGVGGTGLNGRGGLGIPLMAPLLGGVMFGSLLL